MVSKHLVLKVSLSAIFSALIFVSFTQGVAFARSHLRLHPLSFTCSESACDGHYPEDAPWNCASDPNLHAVSGAKFEFNDPTVGDIWVTLMYSPKCGTNWTRVSIIQTMNPTTGLEIRRKNTDGTCYDAVAGGPPHFLSLAAIDSVMLFAPSCAASAGVDFDALRVYTPYF